MRLLRGSGLRGAVPLDGAAVCGIASLEVSAFAATVSGDGSGAGTPEWVRVLAAREEQFVATSREIVRVVKETLERARPEMEAALRSSGLPRMGAILPYWTSAVGDDEMPCLMLQMRDEASSWAALPDVLRQAFGIRIWGIVSWDDPEQLEDAVGNLAAAVRDALNRRHEAIEISQGRWIFFLDSAPVTSVEYGVADVAGVHLRAFLLSWGCEIQEGG